MKEATLFDMFNTHTGRQIDKWRHYFPIYEKHFEYYRGKRPRVLEIGIDHGGSLQLWKRYFGPGAHIIGVDIRPETLFEEPQIQTLSLIHICGRSRCALSLQKGVPTPPPRARG